MGRLEMEKIAGFGIFILSIILIAVLMVETGSNFNGPSYVMGFLTGTMAFGLGVGLHTK